MAGIQENLQQQIDELTAAISKLSNKLNGLEVAGGVVGRSTNATDNKCSHCNEKPARESGYVNWDESHDTIKTMKWLKLEELSKILYGYGARAVIHNVKENTRFPEDELFVSISVPEIMYKIKTNKQLDQLLDKDELLPLIKNHMHTQYSFEEKYKLRWLDPKEQDSK